MGLTITSEKAERIANGVWQLEMSPHEVRLFGAGARTVGPRSVLLLKNYKYDEGEAALSFDLEDAIALNVGTQSEAIAVSAIVQAPTDTSAAGSPIGGVAFGPGDQEFLSLATELLNPPMAKAAAALLSGVRERSVGDLKRGKARNFSDTPDNFWYVIIQPQIQQLSITVRGAVNHFEPVAELPIKDDRGNTLFKVTRERDVPAALKMIFHAKRKHPL